MSEHDRHMVVIDADVSRFKRKMAEATDDATRRLRDTAREANAAFAPAGQMRGRSIGAKFGTGARSLIIPDNIRITVPEDHPRSRQELPQRPSLGDGLGALALRGATAFHIGEVVKNAMKGTFPVFGAPFLGMEVAHRGISKTRSTTLGPVLDRFQEDLARLEELKNLSPRELDRGGDQLTKQVEKFKRNINDAVVSVEEALLQSARGLEALRRPNDGEIPDTLIGKVNVAEFEALKDALGVMAETVNDPKLQQQIQDVLNKQEFISRTGREPEPPTAPTPGFTSLPLPGERDVAGSEFLGTARPGGSGRVQFAGLGFSDAGGFGGADFDQAEESLARFHERLGDLPGAFAQATGPAGELTSQFEALNVPLLQTNTEFGEQFRLLGDLGGLIPEVGGQFSAFLERTAEQGQALNQVVDALGQSFLDAFEGAIQRGESLGDVLKGLLVDLARLAAQRSANALAPPACANPRPPALAMAA